MSAEKEIVNFWYNSQGYFTVNNLKTKNRDVGILAIKFSKGTVADAVYVDVSCSVSSNTLEGNNLDVAINTLVREKFGNPSVMALVEAQISNFSKMRHAIVLGSIPKSRKQEVVDKFLGNEVEAIEFESVLCSVMQGMDTQYYKNDVIRTLQLVKYFLLSEPKMVAQLMGSGMLSNSLKQEFLEYFMAQDDVMRGFRGISEERMGEILRHSSLKNPEKLASVLNASVLNNKTRQPFVDTMMKHKNVAKKMVPKDMPSLKKFF